MPSSAYTKVVQAIYRASMEPELWPQTLTQLADHVGALGGMIAYHAPTAGEEFIVVGRLRDDLTGLYLRDYAHNPYSAAMMRAKPGVVYAAEQLAHHDAIKKTAFYSDILAPQTIRSQLVVGHPSLTRHGTSGGVAVQLSQRHAANIESATQRFSRLVPHLMCGIELALQGGRHQSSPRQIERLLDAIPYAALLLDRAGTITSANRTAETMLVAADGLNVVRSSDGLRLSVTNEGERRLLFLRIAQVLKCAAGDEGELGGTLRVTRPSGRAPLIVFVIPLPPPSFALHAAVDGGSRALVQIIDPLLPIEAQAEHLATAVGLTEAEKRVAAFIGCGLTAPQAATALGLSLATVKTHLAHCFDKTGVRSQSGLAHLVATVFSATRPVTLRR